MYNQLNHEDLCTLETCQLLSEHEQQLKSADNYKQCFMKLVQECPPFKSYLEKNIVPWPADWPGWYYPKKNIAQGKCQLLKQSIISEQGQFHVSLNGAEDTVLIFKYFFDELYELYKSAKQTKNIQSDNMFNCCLIGLVSNPGQSATEVRDLQRP